MDGMPFRLDRAVEILDRTPRVVRELLDGLPADWTSPNEGGDTFSAMDNLGHLIHGEREDWIPRARIILAQGDARRFSPFDRYGHRREIEGQSIGELVRAFGQLRSANLQTLQSWNLSEAHLDLTGEHPAFGPVTLRQLLATWVVHDLGHIAQISRVMSKQYREEVGPWREYLPILDRQAT
jgi:hypothetical protein